MKLEPLPDRTLIVLRTEAKAARDGTMFVQGVDIDMAELLEDAADEIEQLRNMVTDANELLTDPNMGAKNSSWYERFCRWQDDPKNPATLAGTSRPSVAATADND